jgi:hypothetical protein
MMKRPNDGGGTTLMLAEGDDINALPDSHRDVLNDHIREAFRDPAAFFSNVANRTTIPNLSRYLKAFVEQGRCTLLLADTYMPSRKTIGAFQWFHPEQHACMFSPTVEPCSDLRFAPLYKDFAMIHWDLIGFAGGIFSYHNHTTVAHYGAASSDPVFPENSTIVFGNTVGGDMMICSPSGQSGFLSHETGASYVIGTVPEMLDWVFGQLILNQAPKFDALVE